jgi:DNA-binding transcriptional ArsR family regulator
MCASEDILRAMGLEWWQLFYRSAFEYKRAYEASAAQACGAPVHSGRFCVGEGIESWRERRRSYAHRLESHLPDFDWELLDAALNYETPDEGMTVAQGKLGKQFGYSQSTVSRRLAPAVETGLLKSEARSRKGRFAVTAGPGRTSNRYRLDTARIALLLKAVKTKAKEVAARALQPKTRVDEMASALVTLTRLETFLYPMYTIEEAGSDHPPGTRIGSSTRLRGTYHDREATGGREDRARSGFVGTASASLSGTNKITVSDWQPKRACASPSSRAPARGRALR